ncbi:MAG: leucine-rich repeat domain-containing protein, partial [Bacteroidota bacterium]
SGRLLILDSERSTSPRLVKFAQISESFASLTNLYALYLDTNSFKVIPDVIFNLKNLEELSISENPIAIFPEQLVKLPKLEDLDLSDTELTDEQLEKLEELLPDCDVSY